jgi:hypothetical protein
MTTGVTSTWVTLTPDGDTALAEETDRLKVLIARAETTTEDK